MYLKRARGRSLKGSGSLLQEGVMPTGQSWEIHHLPQQISVNEVHRESGRDGGRKQQMIPAVLALISSLTCWFEAGTADPGPWLLC